MAHQVKTKQNSRILLWLVIAGLVLVNVAVFFSPDDHSMRLFWWAFDYHHWPTWYATNLWIIVAGIFLVSVFEAPFVQQCLNRFYASPFWRDGVTRFEQSKFNQNIVWFLLQRRGSRWVLRKWIKFWQGVKVEHYPQYVKYMLFFLVLLVSFRYSVWLAEPRFQILRTYIFLYGFPYWYVYEPFYYGPLTNYMFDGTLSWRIFIAPTTGLLLILWLLHWNRTMKVKGENHAK